MKDLGPISYIVAVLWMHGETAGRIAKAVNWRRDQVNGFIWRLFDQTPRSQFPLKQRQAILDELKADRKDEGRLRAEHFVAKATPDILAKELEAQGAEEPPDLTTRDGRRKAKELRRVAEAKALADQKIKEARELGHAARRGRTAGTKERTMSSALEYLFDHRLLREPGAEQKAAAREGFLPEESRRLEAGLRFRALALGSRTADLGAIDYERATMGGGGGPKIGLAAFKIHCFEQLGTLRIMLTAAEYAEAESVIVNDAFIWEIEPAGSAARGEMYESARYFLDVIGVHEGLMTHEDFKLRWNDDLPIVKRATRGAAAARSDAITEFMEEARG